MPNDKPDQSDILAQFEQVNARMKTIETDLASERQARQRAEADLGAQSKLASELSNEIKELKAKEQDANKKAASQVAQSGIVTPPAQKPQDPAPSNGPKNWTALCAAKLGRMLTAFAGLVLIGSHLQAQSSIQPNIRQVAMPTFPTSVASSTTTTLTSSNCVAKLVPNGGVGLLLKFTGAGAGTSAITVKFGVSQNGSTVSTEDLATWTVAMNGTTPVIAFTNIPPSFIGNAPYIAVRSIQNANANGIASVSLTAFTPPIVR